MGYKNKIKLFLQNLIKSDSAESSILRKNVLFTAIFQFISIICSLILLPITLKFVSIEDYGIWLTISSIVLWISNFDFGLGSGLKNNLITAIAVNDIPKSKALISTAYISISFIMLFIGVLISILFLIIDPNQILGIVNIDNFTLNLTLAIILFFFILRFVLQIYFNIIDAFQKLYLARLNNAISQILIIVIIYVMSWFFNGTLIIIALVYSVVPVITMIISTFMFFKNKSEFTPNFRCFDMSLNKKLFGLGSKFFFIQLSRLILFQSTNLILLRYFGPSEVVVFNVAFNLFSMMNIAFSTVSQPYWAAYTNAWTLGNINWIKTTNKRLVLIWLSIFFVSLIVLIFSQEIYSLWVGTKIAVPKDLSFWIFIYMAVFTFSGVYNMFINATGKVTIQLIALVSAAIIFVPLVVFCIENLNLGMISIPICLLLVSSYSLVLAPIQYYLLVNNKAKGLFNS
ncbi:MAG: oligosaccharide flippase family protein [Bacteroidia bacterium]|nr:oligosaccharide flippase family protein [Bacteroidia bacterium]MCF8445918.1 oligosaccharide flippase family protein [Bacteroidia bacterium]